jgi:hypothetical protein
VLFKIYMVNHFLIVVKLSNRSAWLAADLSASESV